jgi:alginate O-acetyltransferase complex protein AlgI
MLFTSWSFLIFFLPIVVALFALVGRLGLRASNGVLIAASVVFYGFWDPRLVVLLSCSIAFNYGISVAIRRNSGAERLQLALLFIGIAGDIGALFYYKYLFAVLFFIARFGFLDVTTLNPIVLPIGISFFTFTQIGYLVDCQGGITKYNDFSSYVLFVTFFPHLIAGPILHNGEMMPQFANPQNTGFQAKNFSAGLTIFILGMLKKSVLADPLSGFVAEGFADPQALQFFGAWSAILAYSLQLYFDFSGYTDMAIGLALMFNVRFPANFNSPYKATSIVDFWQRWHMTLTRYLTQYLYTPIAMWARRRRIARGLKMSRKALEAPGPFVTLVAMPTMLTMALAGFWHGAGFQYLIFGLLHGVYLTINHAWNMFGPKFAKQPATGVAGFIAMLLAGAITYLAVLVAQVFFRSTDVSDAMTMLSAMVGFGGIEHDLAVPAKLASLLGHRSGWTFHDPSGAQLKLLGWLAVGFAIVWFFPNTQEITAAASPILGPPPKLAWRPLAWSPSRSWAVTMGFAGAVALLSLGGTTEFLYFQF